MSNNWDNWIKLYNGKWINTEKIDSNMYALTPELQSKWSKNQ